MAPPASNINVTNSWTVPESTTDDVDITACPQEDSNIQNEINLEIKNASTNEPSHETKTSSDAEFPPLQIIWTHVFLYGLVHLAGFYGAYLMFTSAMWQTNLFAVCLHVLTGMSVTTGVHRLWSHRTYKARLPLRIWLAFFFIMAFQFDIFEWCRNHRVHHKYSETNADPHNAKRGFFFAHTGWVMCRKHPDVKNKGKTVDVSDLLADPVVRFQKAYYAWLVLLCCFALPTVVPMYFWGETFDNSFFVAAVWRFIYTLHVTFLVNSAAHLWGQRPYDDTINPAENMFVSFLAAGEGFHNFHHTFPQDYSTSEFGFKLNPTKLAIDVLAWLGLAYDRKTVSRDLIAARKRRTGQNKRPLQNDTIRQKQQNGIECLQKPLIQNDSIGVKED